jgi:hypothetical protein
VQTLLTVHPAAGLLVSEVHEGWLHQNSTLVVGVVGIIVSGLLGPSVTAAWAARRERQTDARALAVARRDDLRSVIDEAASALGGAIPALRPLLVAEQAGKPLPREPSDFLSNIVLLGQRLRLRLPEGDSVVDSYEEAHEQLETVSKTLSSQAAFDEAVEEFHRTRNQFLIASRETLETIIKEAVEP